MTNIIGQALIILAVHTNHMQGEVWQSCDDVGCADYATTPADERITSHFHIRKTNQIEMVRVKIGTQSGLELYDVVTAKDLLDKDGWLQTVGIIQLYPFRLGTYITEPQKGGAE